MAGSVVAGGAASASAAVAGGDTGAASAGSGDGAAMASGPAAAVGAPVSVRRAANLASRAEMRETPTKASAYQDQDVDEEIVALDLSLHVPPGKEGDAARQCLAQMSPAQWAALVRLAGQVVCLQERVATGEVFLLAQVGQDRLSAIVRELDPRRR